MQDTNSIGRNVRRSLLLRQATNIGDAIARWLFQPGAPSVGPAKRLSSSAAISIMRFPHLRPVTFPVCRSIPLPIMPSIRLIPDGTLRRPGQTATPAPIAGTAGGDQSHDYLATADVVIPTLSTTAANLTNPNDPHNVVARVRRVFQKQILSLWRYAIFYTDGMEIHPGAPMTVNGDVHTNGSLYTGHNTLTLNGI